MKSYLLVLALLAAAPAFAGGEKPRVFGWNPAPASGWKFDQGAMPKYPATAIRERIEGDVLLAVRISPAGRIDVVESARGEPALVAAVRAAYPGWSFRAAAKDTRPSTAHVPIGIFRQVERPTYDDLARAQVADARDMHGDGDLASLLAGNDTWTVTEESS